MDLVCFEYLKFEFFLLLLDLFFLLEKVESFLKMLLIVLNFFFFLLKFGLLILYVLNKFFLRELCDEFKRMSVCVGWYLVV